MSVVVCCARRDHLCERCRADALAQLAGVAACRGEVWARSVAQRCAAARSWPLFEGRCAQIARRKVADLATDLPLREELAQRAVQAAARWWSQRRRR
jgi:hypothetical protein